MLRDLVEPVVEPSLDDGDGREDGGSGARCAVNSTSFSEFSNTNIRHNPSRHPQLKRSPRRLRRSVVDQEQVQRPDRFKLSVDRIDCSSNDSIIAFDVAVAVLEGVVELDDLLVPVLEESYFLVFGVGGGFEDLAKGDVEGLQSRAIYISVDSSRCSS